MLDALCAVTWRQLVDRQSEFDVVASGRPGFDVHARTRQWVNGARAFCTGWFPRKHSEDLKKRLAAEPLADIIKDMLQITRAAGDDDDDE